MSNGKFGSFACVEGIQNSIDIAQWVLLHSSHILIAGDGARLFAKEQNVPVNHLHCSREGRTCQKGDTSFCDTVGAVACTGAGEFIALKILAKEVYGWLGKNMSPSEAAQKVITQFDNSVKVGLIILTKNECASHARNGMAWSQLTEI